MVEWQTRRWKIIDRGNAESGRQRRGVGVKTVGKRQRGRIVNRWRMVDMSSTENEG
jgi:hypothetical protein